MQKSVIFTRPPKVLEYNLPTDSTPTASSISSSVAIHIASSNAVGNASSSAPSIRLGNASSNPSDTVSDTASSIAINDFVAVQVSCVGKQMTKKMHIAKVINILPADQFVLSYMMQSNSHNNLYTWPPGEEVFFVHPILDIICVLKESLTFIGSRMFSQFDMSHAQQKLSCTNEQ
ncbi:uncharacterized protein LOC117290924 [Asterias rubens]|uniref:uncharacterized protein LOC117290924 n=1 Tax=Asterias rubens TaxID=7604 RepID=UPI0014558C98|nr:uncharacterized protein LOC117290924 [Asterias rubens]